MLTNEEIEQLKKLHVNISRVMRLLTAKSPDYFDLEMAFLWCGHPKGWNFWTYECNQLEASNSLSKEAREELERIILIKELS